MCFPLILNRMYHFFFLKRTMVANAKSTMPSKRWGVLFGRAPGLYKCFYHSLIILLYVVYNVFSERNESPSKLIHLADRNYSLAIYIAVTNCCHRCQQHNFVLKSSYMATSRHFKIFLKTALILYCTAPAAGVYAQLNS